MNLKSTSLSLLFILLLIYVARPQSGPMVLPVPSTEICPLQGGGILFALDDYDDQENYTLKNVKGCSIISNINSQYRFVLSFSDKKEEHSISLYTQAGTNLVKKFIFSKIKTLDGLELKFTTPPPIPPPTGYGDIMNIPFCNTNTFNYVGPLAWYKDADGNNFGTFNMSFYEYLVPAGWKVNGTTSNGTNPIQTSGPAADITPDALTPGVIKLRALNNCDPFSLKRSNWFQVYVVRPVLSLATTTGETSLPLTCGTSSTHTFEVKNGNLAPCATYEWDLGSENNNWIYNGNLPAPRYITSTTNTLTLTSSTCTGAPTSIKVKVKINGVDQKTFDLPVTMTVPTFEITGLPVVCNAENYVIYNLPCNATVSWSLAFGRTATIISSGNTATVTKRLNGTATLKAIITGACSAPVTLEKELYIGTAPAFITGPFDPVQHTPMGIAYSGYQYYFVANEYTPSPPSTYFWTLIPYPGSTNFPSISSGSPSYNMIIPYEIADCTYTIRLEKTNECGAATSEMAILVRENITGLSISTSPNPVKEELIVKLNKPKSLQTSKDEKIIIILYDFNTGKHIKQTSFNGSQSQFRVNVKGLKKGKYVLQFVRGKSVQTKQIVID